MSPEESAGMPSLLVQMARWTHDPHCWMCDTRRSHPIGSADRNETMHVGISNSFILKLIS